ncbi:hypothetical protein ABEF95_013996 [Exophiala dermatitidis]
MPRQLRSIIKTPARYADRDDAQPKPRNGTRPEFPALLQATIVPFNPNHPPAAFPSLPLTGQKSHQEIVTNPTDLPEAPPRPTSPPVISPSPTRDLVNRYEAGYRNGQPLFGSLGLPPAVRDSDDMDTSDSESVVSHTREASNIDPEAPTWASLPLSLQYHIYMTLSEEYDRDKLCRVLGLKDQEKDEIGTAVQDRHDHPYSLAELWSYGCHHSAPVPGIDEPNTSIDPDMLDKLMPDMLLVSRYELAYESEVLSAACFLSSRSLPAELLGDWVPDTDGLESICPAGMLRQQDNQTGATEVEPGESSTAEPDCTVGEAHDVAEDETEVAKSKPKAQKKKRQLQSPAARAIKKAQGTKKKQPKKRGPKAAAPKAQKKRGPHPLATVTTPDSSGSPKSRSRKKTQKKATSGGPRRLSLIFKPAVGGGKPTIQQQQKQQPPRLCTPERPSSSLITSPSSSGGTADQPPSARLLSFDTKMSSFSRELILNEEGSSPANDAVESSPTSVASASGGVLGRAATPTPTPTVLSKRKASQSDIRLSPPQIPRVSSFAGVKAYWRKSTINGGGNIDNCCYHGRSQTAFGDGPASTGMATNSDAQMDKVIPSIEAPASGVTTTNKDVFGPPGSPRRPSYSPITENEDDEEWQALLQGKTRFRAPGSPRRPSYSPITENEADEEWQAKLRGPVAGNTKTNYRTRLRLSAPSSLLPVNRESKRGSLASAWLAADNRPSIDRKPSSAYYHTSSSSLNDRSLSGSVDARKTTGSGSLPLSGVANPNQSATSSSTSTPRLRLVFKRRSVPETPAAGEMEAKPSIVEEVLAEMKEEQEQDEKGIASRTRSSLSRMGTSTPAPAAAEPTTKKTKGTAATKKKPAKKTATATAAANAKSGNKVQKSTTAKRGPKKKTKTLEKRQAKVAGEKARRRLSL